MMVTARGPSLTWILGVAALGVCALPACGDPAVVIGSDVPLNQPNTTIADGSDGGERDDVCSEGTDCEDSKPFCRAGLCVECLTNADCEESDESVCSLAEGECVSQ